MYVKDKAPKAVRSILYIHWKLRYYPSNNPMNYLATNVTKKLDHNTLYSMGIHTFERIAVEAKAKLKIGKSVLYNVEKVDEYLEHFYVEE